MAADPRYIPLLLGMGIHELSMSALSIGPIRRIIRKLHTHEAEEVLRDAMQCKTADEVLDLTESLLNDVAPDVLRITLYGE
jgi:phosphotransferase system enzyme I (PtsI)